MRRDKPECNYNYEEIEEKQGMDVNIESLCKTYSALGDELSKEIYMNRVMYAISGDLKWIHNLFFTNDKIKKFADTVYTYSQQNEIVIFGAGKRGKTLCDILNFVPWKCFVDNNPQNKEVGGVPVISYGEFASNYHGEYVVISSRLYREEMKSQLADDGIVEKVINFGEILEELRKDQYFDLEYMQPTGEKEYFVDAGCYDADSSVNFAKWCNGNAFIYAFEPNINQIEACKFNLSARNIEFKIVSKGVWSSERELRFRLNGSGSRINEGGEEVVSVTTLDKELANEKVTFIKMDVEGAEIEALIGAKNTIMRNKPRLAICVYHKREDIFLIPDLILQYYSGYRFFLRHYSAVNTETVLYALPT